MLVVDQDATDGMSDAGVALFRAFNYIRKNHTPVKALSFITDVSYYLWKQMLHSEKCYLLNCV